jgi:Domain of unknown function (DUF5664)
MSGDHFDEGKPRVDLLDPEALLGISRVLSFGATKYAAHNWRGGIRYSRIIGSILRHLFAIMGGEDIDKESGLPHVDHCGCDIMFLSYYMKKRSDLDDRFKPSTTGRPTDVQADAEPNDSGPVKRERTSSPIRSGPGKDVDRSLYPPQQVRNPDSAWDTTTGSFPAASRLVDSSPKGSSSPSQSPRGYIDTLDSIYRWEAACRRTDYERPGFRGGRK